MWTSNVINRVVVYLIFFWESWCKNTKVFGMYKNHSSAVLVFFAAISHSWVDRMLLTLCLEYFDIHWHSATFPLKSIFFYWCTIRATVGYLIAKPIPIKTQGFHIVYHFIPLFVRLFYLFCDSMHFQNKVYRITRYIYIYIYLLTNLTMV